MSFTRDVQLAYIAFFNRPAEPQGLQAWAAFAEQQGGMRNVISTFSSTDEYLSLYAGLSNRARVDQIYRYLFNRPAEELGLNAWVAELDAGRISLGYIAFAIASGALGTDLETVNNKVSCADLFSQEVSRLGIPYVGYGASFRAKEWLQPVDFTPTSARTAINSLSQVVSSIGADHSWLVNESYANILQSYVRTLRQPELKYFVDLTGSGRTRFLQSDNISPIRCLPFDDSLTNFLRVGLERIDTMAGRFVLREVDDPFAADLELHVIDVNQLSDPSFPGSVVTGQTTTRSLGGVGSSQPTYVYSRIDLVRTGTANYMQHVAVHELGHWLGLEHPFDSADGDRMLGLTTADTVMEYTPSAVARSTGVWENWFRPVDLQVLYDLWH